MAFRCVDRDLWDLKFYCKYILQAKRFYPRINIQMCFVKIWRVRFVDFDKTHLNIHSRIKPFCSSIPYQLGRLSPPHFFSPLLIFKPSAIPFTLESGIDEGQGINIGPGKFAQKNRAWNLINVGPLIRFNKCKIIKPRAYLYSGL